MIIEELKLTNCGRHAALEFTPRGPIAGLLGPNGSGKSTVLAMLEFGITGETEQNLDTYVRRLDGNGSVSLRFRKNGKVGTVFRQFGKTSKRSLIWDGKKTTSADEVNKTMAEIFGADKKAIANAVFVRQGEMEKILFGKNQERKMAFIKIVNMAHCAARAEIVDRRIKQISSGMVDLSATRDAAAEARVAALQAVTQREAEVSQQPNPAEELRAMRELNQLEKSAQEAEAVLATACTRIGTLTRDLAGHLQASQLETVEDMEGVLVQHRQKSQALNDQLQAQKQLEMELVHYERAKAEITRLGSEWESIKARIRELNPQALTLPFIQSTIAGLKLAMEKWNKVERIKANLAEAEANIVRLKQNLDQQEAKMADAEAKAETSTAQLAILAAQLAEQDGNNASLKRILMAREELARCVVPGATECPKCGLKVHDPDALSAENMKGLKTLLATMTQKTAELRRQYEDLDRWWKATRTEHTGIRSGWQQWLANYEQNQAALNSMGVLPPKQETLDLLERYQNVQALLPGLQAQKLNIEAQLKTALRLRDSYTQARSYKGTRPELRSVIEQLEIQYRESVEGLEPWEAALQTARRIAAELAAAHNDYPRIANQHSDLTNKIQELRKKYPSTAETFIRLAELEARQELYQQALGKLEEARSNYQVANRAFHDIEARMAKDAATRQILARLIKVREILSNDGLPMAVVRHHFEYLAALTQKSLADMNSNFEIFIDRSEALSFTFKRLDEDDAVELPQSKLSGGQKVRLAVAFLLAVQRHLVPEVGFLCCDEPLIHADSVAVEEIVELFRSLQVTLKHTEFQIFIVDHNPALEPALTDVLKLT